MVKLTIDNKPYEVEDGITILEAARRNYIEIPTLCYDDNLSSPGACRLCVVEITKGKRTKIVTSCIYQVEEGLVVQTASERVLRVRKLVLELLLARCSKSELIQRYAKEMGIEKSRFKAEDGNCMLCGLCVRACEEVVGRSAISFANRGATKEVQTPFMDKSADCIGCGACAYVCPMNTIPMTDKDGKRTIWGRDFKLKKCKSCGNYFAPEEQLEYIRKKANLPANQFDLCFTCKK